MSMHDVGRHDMSVRSEAKDRHCMGVQRVGMHDMDMPGVGLH
jgi:hypothetical protein